MFAFYSIDENYINYLKLYDSKVPDIVYNQRNKFVCGLLLEVDEFNYFAPISHFNVKQRTNFPIYQNDLIISTVRLCFMFPIPKGIDVLHKLDFSKISQNDKLYADLLEYEYSYCKSNLNKLQKQTNKVYRIGLNKNHVLNETCCDFKKLEIECKNYNSHIVY